MWRLTWGALLLGRALLIGTLRYIHIYIYIFESIYVVVIHGKLHTKGCRKYAPILLMLMSTPFFSFPDFLAN